MKDCRRFPSAQSERVLDYGSKLPDWGKGAILRLAPNSPTPQQGSQNHEPFLATTRTSDSLEIPIFIIDQVVYRLYPITLQSPKKINHRFGVIFSRKEPLD